MSNLEAPVTATPLNAELQSKLRCPVCRAELGWEPTQCQCLASKCRATFPVINGIPILINEAGSVFSIREIVQNMQVPGEPPGALKRLIWSIPELLSSNRMAAGNYRQMAAQLLEFAARPDVLVVGGGVTGEGIGELVRDPRITVVETDIARGPRTGLICDAHDLPFEGGAFDGVVIQAVLEHVVDPARCLEEVRRVLKPGGIVYAETPFMQQVHLGRYDFTRFTHLGHRRLFRHFQEIQSGPTGGPGMALCWSIHAFCRGFFRNRWARNLVDVLVPPVIFWLKYFDAWLTRNKDAFDTASGYYFLGRLSGEPLGDRELIRSYRGAQ